MEEDVQVTTVEIDDHLQAKPKSCLLRIPALPFIRNDHTHGPSVPLWRVAISVALLFTNYFLAQYDKFILSYFQSDLTTSLSMTLSEYGILSGYATGIVYALLTLPVAYWADYTRYRVWLLSASAVWWSICVIFQGLSHNFWQILLARIGMGIGQAPVEALSVSLISDMVGKEWVFFFVASIIYMGLYVGEAISAQIATVFRKTAMPWNTAMKAVGIVGLVVGVLLRIVIREPARETSLNLREETNKLVGETTMPFASLAVIYVSSLFGDTQ